MIRFIDLGDQICEGTKEFAFFDTVVDQFVEVSGDFTFETVSQFKSYWQTAEEFNEYSNRWIGYEKLERFTSLIPKDWKE